MVSIDPGSFVSLCIAGLARSAKDSVVNAFGHIGFDVFKELFMGYTIG